MIEIKSLYKHYHGKRVLENIHVMIPDGSIFGLIGINGAGKTTLLKLISGILKPDIGDIKIDDISPVYHEDIRKKIFYLSDQPNYAPSLSLNDLAHLYDVFYPFERDTFLDILNLFGLSKDTTFGQLSKGMRRQGMIAIAFASGAKYLLLDEVFDGLDPSARLKFKKLMIEHQNNEKIFILTSHSLRELEDICDTFGMIDQGHFKKYGDLETELHKIKKYQVILKSTDPLTLNFDHPSFHHFNQNGRVLTLICDSTFEISQYINQEHYLVCDVSTITFEEYFLIQQGGEL